MLYVVTYMVTKNACSSKSMIQSLIYTYSFNNVDLS